MLTLAQEKQLQSKSYGSVSPDNERFAVFSLFARCMLSLSCISIDNRLLPLSSLRSLPD